MGNDSKSKNSFLEGGTMSHPVNDEILENLFEEAYDHFSSNHPHWSEEKICYWAERNAKRRFEEMS